MTCTWLKGWVARSDFDRTAGKLGPGDGAPADRVAAMTMKMERAAAAVNA